MAEIVMRDEEVVNLLDTIEKMVDNLESSNHKENDVREIEAKLGRASEARRMLMLEVRQLDQGSDLKQKYRQRQKEHKQRIADAKAKLNWAKDKYLRDDLLGDRKEVVDAPDLNTAAGMIKHADDIMDDDIKRLQRTTGVVAEIKETGQNIAVTLEEQRKQIETVYNDLFAIDDTVKRSTAIMRRMMRRTATNKYMWCLIGMIFVGVIFIIAWEASGQGGSSSTPDNV